MHPRQRSITDVLGEDRVAVVLACIYCSRMETILVPREKATFGRICWECIQCQGNALVHPVSRAEATRAARSTVNR